MTDFDELMNDWRNWVLRRNRAQLGYAMSGYAERVGSGSYGRDDPEPRLDLIRLNDIITDAKLFPIPLRDLILLHYLDPDPVKRKCGAGGRDAYYIRLKVAKEVLWQIYDPDAVQVQNANCYA